MTLAPSGGLGIHYQDDGDGFPLLVLAGFAMSGLLWPASWVSPLTREHRVLRVCNRGMGRSEVPTAEFTTTDMARDALAVLDSLEIDRAAVLGWSMGGTVAQEIAMIAPERVSRLVLANTWAPGGTQRPEAIQLGSTSVWTRLSGASHQEREELRELDAAYPAMPPPLQVLMFQMQALVAWNVERDISVPQPTLILHGADDPLIPVDNGRRLAKLIPHADYVELDGVGHMFAWEEPARTASLINAFLAE